MNEKDFFPSREGNLFCVLQGKKKFVFSKKSKLSQFRKRFHNKVCNLFVIYEIFRIFDILKKHYCHQLNCIVY